MKLFSQLLLVLFFGLLSSCKLLYHKPTEIYGEVRLEYEDFEAVPINANLKLYDKSFNLLSIVDSSHNGKYLFQFEKNRDKEYFIIMSNIKLSNGPITKYNRYAFWPCLNKPDTILVKKQGEQLPIIVDKCEVNVTSGVTGTNRGLIDWDK